MEDSDVSDTSGQTTEIAFTQWHEKMCLAHPMSIFWSRILDFELTLLSFVRSLRTSDFELYKEALAQLIPWFFALDHVHYSRWLSVHVRDMTTLSQRCPDVYDLQFMLGAFTSNVTGNRFSSIGLDQAHEHLNAQVKGDGGAIGLTENPGTLRRWMVAGPQLSTIIAEFVERFGLDDGGEADGQHHEQSHSYQKSYFEDVCSLVSTFEELWNPFLDRSNDLVTMDTREILPEAVVETVGKIHLREQNSTKHSLRRDC